MHRGAAELEDTGALQNQHTQGYSRTSIHRITPGPAYTGVLQDQYTGVLQDQHTQEYPGPG